MPAVAKREEQNHLSVLKATQRTELLKYAQRLVPRCGPAPTRAGELLRHAMLICSTPVGELLRYERTARIMEAKYVLLCATDLELVAKELKIPSWTILIFDVMTFPSRDNEIRQLLSVVLRFIEHHTCVDDTTQAK